MSGSGRADPTDAPRPMIAAVESGSVAGKAGLVSGDRILSVSGEPLRDLVDWRWNACGPTVDLVVLAADGCVRTVQLKRVAGEDLGVKFDGLVFDAVRTCENACEFCFVSQLPPGLRPSLYVRDDDYRLSFLAGNFITLTNLTEADVERIVCMRLSPLYVSLHAVDPEVRRRLIRASGMDDAVRILGRLLKEGIESHVQIVLVPGVNDGATLEETLDWLEARAGVRSVGVVPLGYTGHQSRYDAAYSGEEARRVLDAVHGRRERRTGRGLGPWVHAADELYLAAERPMPSWDAYEGFPQYENGIGLVRSFEDELAQTLAALLGAGTGKEPPAVTLLSGTLFAPVLRRLLSLVERSGVQARVLAVPNRFFGGGISVTGLLTGEDLLASINEDAGPGPYLVPDVTLNADGMTLDGLSARELVVRADGDVRIVPTDAPGLVETLTSRHPKE